MTEKSKSKGVSPRNRQRVLLETRRFKMAKSAHAYVRGSTAKFYEWLEGAELKSIPTGPSVWICGDCHSGNLGPTGNVDGEIDVQIRDLDQTVIGNPAHDLIRLALSLASAIRGSDLPGVTTAVMLERMTRGYAQALNARRRTIVEVPDSVQLILRNAMKRRWKQLAQERIGTIEPRFPIGERFWPVTRAETDAIDALFAGESMRRLVTSLHHRKNNASIKVVDRAYWMKGCSSLGALRFAVLLRVGGKSTEEEGRFCIMDIKEAPTAVAPRDPAASMPRDNAERVVAGALSIAPHLGERMLAARFEGCPVFVRELFPQDLKFDLEHMSRAEVSDVAFYLASVIGQAHARQVGPDARREWRKALLADRSKSLDAPSWLWRATVSLIGIHDAAYLEHCRRHATQLNGRSMSTGS